MDFLREERRSGEDGRFLPFAPSCSPTQVESFAEHRFRTNADFRSLRFPGTGTLSFTPHLTLCTTGSPLAVLLGSARLHRPRDVRATVASAPDVRFASAPGELGRIPRFVTVRARRPDAHFARLGGDAASTWSPPAVARAGLARGTGGGTLKRARPEWSGSSLGGKGQYCFNKPFWLETFSLVGRS